MLGRILCTKCTLHSNNRLNSCDIPTHKTTSPSGAAIFSLHTLASPSGRNMNCDEKKTYWGKFFFLSCSFYLHGFRKYVSYGFPIINFCIPGVHYETPCIRHGKHSLQYYCSFGGNENAGIRRLFTPSAAYTAAIILFS